MFYNLWWNGNNHTVTGLVWLSPDGVDRAAVQDVKFKFYDGVPSDFRPASNPNNLLLQFLADTVAPSDLYGTAALTWRHRDPDRRDSVWAYVPALRRIRAISPANRSDGFLRSDMSQDDGQFFDGKPEDFDWTLVGKREALRFVDPYLLGGGSGGNPPEPEALPAGGWRARFTEEPTYGLEKPGWRGAPWAPIGMQIAPRTVWIVEGVPKDRYYLYGKIQLWIASDNWQGTYNRRFGWDGELLMSGQVRGGPPGRYTGPHYTWQGPGNASCLQLVENLKLKRATVATNRRIELPQARHVPMDSHLFDYQTLYRLGK